MFDGRPEHNVLMKGPLVVASMEGRKTETRRVPPGRFLRWRKGDFVYVRETFWQLQQWTPDGWRWTDPVRDPGPIASYGESVPSTDLRTERWKCRPSIHMPKWAARLLLELTEDVTVERLQAITQRDVEAEGLKPEGVGRTWPWCTTWHELWDDINASRGYSWKSNPEVAVIRYRVVGTTGRPD